MFDDWIDTVLILCLIVGQLVLKVSEYFTGTLWVSVASWFGSR